MQIAKFKWLKRRATTKPTSLVGVDIGTTSIKLLGLSQLDTGCYRVMNYAIAPLPAGTVVEKDIKDPSVVAAALRQSCAAIGFEGQQAVMALPDSLVITKTVQIAANFLGHNQEKQILEEAQHHIPYPIEEVSLDFQIVGPNQDQSDKTDVLIVAARKNQVETRATLMAESGLKLIAVEVESHAIERWHALLAQKLLPTAESKIVAIADLGATTVNLTLLRGSQIVFTRSEPFLENHPAQNNTIVLLLRRALQFFSSSHPKEQVAYFVITGGGALLLELTELIQEQLNIAAFVLNTFSTMEIAQDTDQQMLSSVAPRLILSCGLALRGLSCH